MVLFLTIYGLAVLIGMPTTYGFLIIAGWVAMIGGLRMCSRRAEERG